jgi:hypothetical protein
MPADSREGLPTEATLSEFFETKPSNVTFRIKEKIDPREFQTYPKSSSSDFA